MIEEEKILLLDESLADLIETARSWWRGHRPEGWTLEQHLETPAVNAGYTARAEVLACVVARLERVLRMLDAEQAESADVATRDLPTEMT